MRRRRSTLYGAVVAVVVLLTPAQMEAAHVQAAHEAAGLVPLALFTAIPSAAATPSCWGVTCEDQYAADMGCQDDAYVVASFQMTDPQASQPPEADLWYSPACHAGWGEYYTTDPQDSRVVVLYSEPEYGGVESGIDVTVFGAGDNRTTMLDWNNSLKFCAEPGGIDLCTRWR